MEVAIHLPDDVAAAVPWDDLPRHILERIAQEGYQDGWLREEQVRRLLGYETRLEVHGFIALAHELQAPLRNPNICPAALSTTQIPTHTCDPSPHGSALLSLMKWKSS